MLYKLHFMNLPNRYCMNLFSIIFKVNLIFMEHTFIANIIIRYANNFLFRILLDTMKWNVKIIKFNLIRSKWINEMWVWRYNKSKVVLKKDFTNLEKMLLMKITTQSKLLDQSSGLFPEKNNPYLIRKCKIIKLIILIICWNYKYKNPNILQLTNNKNNNGFAWDSI